jgi:hypothetical protein
MKKYLFVIVVSILGLSLAGSISVSAANSCKPEKVGGVTIECPPTGDVDVTTGDTKGIEETVGGAVGYVMWAVGVVSVIMIVIGGIMYATASGDEAKTAKARKIIIGALVGLAVAILAYTITYFVMDQIRKTP